MRKLAILAGLLLTAACDGGSPVDVPVVRSVTVTTSPTTITVGETAQATAIVKDQNGNALPEKTVAWVSLNPQVASVTQAGLVTGLQPGTAVIQGAVDGIFGRGEVVVVAGSPACSIGVTVIDLPRGGVSVRSSSDVNGCIRFPATQEAANHVVVAANTNPTPDAIGEYIIRGNAGEAVPTGNVLTARAASSAMAALTPPGAADLQSRFESRIRKTERSELDLPAAQRAFRERTRSGQARYSIASAVPGVNDKREFKTPTENGESGGCTRFTRITATAQFVSARSIIYTDDASPATFTAAEYEQIALEFDNLIYPTDVSFFGTPLDLDANERIILLYTPEVNKLTPSGNQSFVGGFFFAGDLFPAAGTGLICPQSNVGEVFYLLSPDPLGTINGNRREVSTVRQGTRGTIAHEFEHMINASERIRSPIDQPFEDVWLDEALAHFAEDATGRVLKGIGEFENASHARLRGTGGMGSADFNDYSAFFFQNFARFERYMRAPGNNAPTSGAADSSLAVRGSAWALLRYAADQFAPGNDVRAFTRALAGGPDVGVANLLKRAGNIPFDTLIAGWMLANFADDLGIPNLSSRYTYRTYDMRSNLTNVLGQNSAYPLLVSSAGGDGFNSGVLQARSGSGNYFSFPRAAGSPPHTVRFQNSNGLTAASFSGARLFILRH